MNIEILRTEEAPRDWQVTLKVWQNVTNGKNIPYEFSVEVVGLFEISSVPGVEIKDPEKFVRINGSSLLFGVAREIIRNNTSAGPYVPIMLPTVNFCAYNSVNELKVSDAKGIEQGHGVLPNVAKPATPKTARKKPKPL